MENIPEKFNREDLDEAYSAYLTELRPPIEATTIKMQNAFLQAQEQAYRIRHHSIPRALAAGYMEGNRWASGCMPFILTERINFLGDLAMMDYNSKNSED